MEQKLVINTDVLQELISKSVKACSMIDGFRITSLIGLQCVDGNLTVTTTDNVNVLKLCKSNLVGSLDVVVDARLFSALVAKLTTPITELCVRDNVLLVRANGEWPLALVTEDDGSAVEFPKLDFSDELPCNHIDNTQIKSILTMNKSCKAEMKEIPSIFNYYMDSERVLTTDYYKVCSNPVKVFNIPVAVPPEIAELIPLVADDKGVDVRESENLISFSSTSGTLVGRKAVAEDLETFPVKDLVESLDDNFPFQCIINRTLLLNALDRACLFTEGLSANAVLLKFDQTKVDMTAKNIVSNESVKYLQPSNVVEPFSCQIDGVLLKNQLVAIPREDIILKFGNENGIQILCDKIVQTLCTLEEE